MATAATHQAPAALDRLRGQLDKAGLTALLLTSPNGRRFALPPDAAAATAVLLTADGTVASATGDLSAATAAALRATGTGDGVVGTEAELPPDILRQADGTGVRLRPAADLVFAELACCEPAELPAFAAAAALAAVGYTAVMDHLRVGLDVRELSGNVDRSVRRAGGLLGWYDPYGSGAAAGTDLVTVRGHDPATARLTAATPLRYVLHPLLAGTAGYAAATAVLSKADGPLRTAGDVGAAATAALLAALRPGARLTDGYAAFDREAGEHGATCRLVALRGGGASLPLGPDSTVVAEPGMVLGVRTEVLAPGRGAVELAETVTVTAEGAEPQASTPLRLVELY
ncbi:M24 family metallopeptidase [Streptomyces shenzhenensis]|uniref:M24 family metallopeptidase n=3 Tax=Streptomyces shenzhenensis TaxID=943815 RepID=UPI003674645D